MKPELAALARHRMAQAQETLADGDFATIDPADAQDLSRAVRAFVHACGELLQRLVAEE